LKYFILFTTLFFILASPSFAQKESSYTCAVSAMISPKETFVSYQELVDYISKRMGKKVAMKQRRTYQEINKMLQLGDVDFAFICTGPFLEGREEFGLIPLVVPVVRGEPYYHSYVIVHRNSPLFQFQDLKGKKFAFTDPLSLSGRLFPLYVLRKEGFPPESFFTAAIYTYSHDNSIEAVATKLVDGAAVDSLVWEFFQAKSSPFALQTRVVLKSPPLGIPPVVTSPKFPHKSREQLKIVLLEMEKDPEGKRILRDLKIDRFIKPPPHLYDSVMEMKKFLQSPISR
jgi:phosphonate transport system substrate-binding protein